MDILKRLFKALRRKRDPWMDVRIADENALNRAFVEGVECCSKRCSLSANPYDQYRSTAQHVQFVFGYSFELRRQTEEDFENDPYHQGFFAELENPDFIVCPYLDGTYEGSQFEEGRRGARRYQNMHDLFANGRF